MKKAASILLLGVILALGAYAGVYITRTKNAAALYRTDRPELAWLKEEFSVSDEEFERIRKLHEGYLPECARMCGEISALNAELENMVLETNQVTPEISAKLLEIGRIRQECQARMLKHFYAVSQAMPPEQGRRYLARMQELTSLSAMPGHAASSPAQHAH